MGIPDQTLAVKNGLNGGYGFGAAARDRHGLIGKAHSGNIVGYHAMFYWFPDQKTAFFISHNMDSESANYEKFNQILIQHLGLGKTPAQIEQKPMKVLEEWNGYFIPRIPKVSNLAYLDLLTGFVKIKGEDKGIVLKPFMKDPRILHHLGDNKFQAEGKTERSHVGLRDENGDLILTDGISNIIKVNSLKLILHWLSALAGGLSILGILILGLLFPSNYFYKKRPQPFFFPILGLLTVFLSIPFFVFQPFVALGDITAASVLVFLGTAWFAFGLVLGGIQLLLEGFREMRAKISFIFIFFALQWMIVLLSWSVIPFRLWN